MIPAVPAGVALTRRRGGNSHGSSLLPGNHRGGPSLVLESWPLVIGTIFSAFVLFLPKGVRGTLTGGIHGRQSA
jgi:hypothetical protein